MTGTEPPRGRVTAAQIKEWLEENLQATWAEGPDAFARSLEFADDILLYMDRDDDWAEAHLLLGKLYEGVASVASAAGGEGVYAGGVYRDHACAAYETAAKAFFMLDRPEPARECQVAGDRIRAQSQADGAGC